MIKNKQIFEFTQNEGYLRYSISRISDTSKQIEVIDHNTSEPLFSHVIQGDSFKLLQNIPDNSFRSCITSPPYWGLRDY